MFCAGSLQPASVLQQIGPLIGALRNAGQNGALNRQTQRTSCQAPASADHEHQQTTLWAQRTLRELGFGSTSSPHIIEALSSQLFLPLAPPPHATNVSSSSFFENKNGFPQHALSLSRYSDVPSIPVQVSLSSLAHSLTPRTVQYQTRRGFKTKKSQTSTSAFGSKRVSEDSFSPLKFVKESRWTAGSNRARHNEKLKQLIEECPPESRDKMHIAFAEGYLANDTKESDQGRWGRVLLKVLQYGLLTALLVLIFNSTTAMFSNMKLEVLKGDRYEVNPEEISVTFADVKGVDEAKDELEDVVEFLRDPEKFQALGARLPKGVLLVGPPGVGKTLLARAVAGEAGVPFFHASGSEFDEIFVGTGAKRVRQLFDAAKMRAPCLIFIDEMDTVGHTRTSSITHPYANQTINQLLSEMDGFAQTEGVIVLGATNRKDNLDQALLRPGRFDVEVSVSPPDLKGRLDILELYMSQVKMGADIDVELLARRTIGCTGADLKNMVNQAALKAAIDGDSSVNMTHMNHAMDKILMGPAKKSKIPDDDTNLKTAYHEAGHTIVAYFTKDANALHKVTIIPRGNSLGHTSFVPVKEKYSTTKSQMLANMDVAMGGRAAEEIIYGSDMITSGASADFQSATSIATGMVTKCGMSEKVGCRVFDDRDVYKPNDVSPATMEMIDAEIKRFLQESYDRAKSILKSHPSELHELAKALMKYETLDVDDIKTIMSGKKLKRPLSANPSVISHPSDTPRPKSKPPNNGLPSPL